MRTQETWNYIHSERAAMAETWADLTAEQWGADSWCDGWTVRDTAGHIVAAAEQTPLNFYKELTAARFRFNVFTARGVERFGTVSADELIRRLRARTSTTNHPPAPVVAMLGEIVVHGGDIRGPLGLPHDCPEAALAAVADNYKRSNLLIGSKRRIAGLHLRATDSDWAWGTGPEVSGPLLTLVQAMAGRQGAHRELAGEGVPILAGRG